MIPENEIERQREALYTLYNKEIKPLVAEIEARFEEFPEPLLAEIFFFNDYMANGYRESITEKEYDESIELALKHLTQLKLYLYVYLNAALVLVIELFEEQTLNVDLNAINDGSFFKEYTRKKKSAESKLMLAKERERWLSATEVLTLYQDAYQDYIKLEDFLNLKSCEVNRAVSMYHLSFKSKLFIWIFPILISAVVSFFYPSEVKSYLFSILNK